MRNFLHFIIYRCLLGAKTSKIMKNNDVMWQMGGTSSKRLLVVKQQKIILM